MSSLVKALDRRFLGIGYALRGLRVSVLFLALAAPEAWSIPPLPFPPQEPGLTSLILERVQQVSVSVTETLVVTDALAVLPPAVVDVEETIGVSDTPQTLLPVIVSVTEAIGVDDRVQALPPVTISVSVDIVVTDDLRVLPPVEIAVSEAVSLTDAVNALPEVSITVSEIISVTDFGVVVPPTEIWLEEQISVVDGVAILPEVRVEVQEAIIVADAPDLVPPALVTVHETVSVADAAQALPSLSIALTERITVGDAPGVLPPASITVEEPIQLADEVRLLPWAVIRVSERVSVSDAVGAVPPAILEVGEPVIVSDGLFLLADAIIRITEQISILDMPDLLLPADLALSIGSYKCNKAKSLMPVTILTTQSFDATRVDHSTVRFGKEGTEAAETHVNKRTGEFQRHEADVDEDGDLDLLFHFVFGETGLDCDDETANLTGKTFDGAQIAAAAYISVSDGKSSEQDMGPELAVLSTQPSLVGSRPALYTVSVGSFFAGQSVSLSCTDLPRRTSCSFSPSVLKPGADGGSATLAVFPVRESASPPPGPSGGGHPSGLMALGLLLSAAWLLAHRNRAGKDWSVALPLLMLLLGVVLYSACTDDNPFSLELVGPGPGQYTFTVTATAGVNQRHVDVQLVVR